MFPTCFDRKNASDDIQYYLLAQRVTLRVLDLSSKFDIAILRSTYTHFDASRREEQYAAKIMSLAYIVQSYLRIFQFSKTIFPKTRYFYIS